MHAIIITGQSHYMTVMRGLPLSAVQYLDSHRKRTFVDNFHYAGYGEATDAQTRIINLMYEFGSSKFRPINDFEFHARAKFYEKHLKFADAAMVMVRPIKKKKNVVAGVLARAFETTPEFEGKIGKELATRFILILAGKIKDETNYEKNATILRSLMEDGSSMNGNSGRKIITSYVEQALFNFINKIPAPRTFVREEKGSKGSQGYFNIE